MERDNSERLIAARHAYAQNQALKSLCRMALSLREVLEASDVVGASLRVNGSVDAERDRDLQTAVAHAVMMEVRRTFRAGGLREKSVQAILAAANEQTDDLFRDAHPLTDAELERWQGAVEMRRDADVVAVG